MRGWSLTSVKTRGRRHPLIQNGAEKFGFKRRIEAKKTKVVRERDFRSEEKKFRPREASRKSQEEREKPRKGVG